MGNELAVLVEDADFIKAEIRLGIGNGVKSNYHFLRAGDRLIQVKARKEMKHGMFQRWIEDHCEVSYPQASCYMRAAKSIARNSFDGTEPLRGMLESDKEAKKEARKDGVVEQAEQVDDGCTVADLDALVERGVKFGTIYADPPWAYGNQSTRAATDNHYVTMAVEDICDLPIEELAADKSHLHLWTTNAFLFDAKTVMEAWGFEYKSCFVWVKPQMGIGNYWRVSHEFMLLGVRGGMTFVDRGLASWASHSRGKHSAKPEAVRHLVEAAGCGPRLELFGRKAVEGWTVWGNEVSRDLLTEGIPAL